MELFPMGKQIEHVGRLWTGERGFGQCWHFLTWLTKNGQMIYHKTVTPKSCGELMMIIDLFFCQPNSKMPTSIVALTISSP